MKLWGGRFDKDINKAAFDFQSSIRVDKRMYKQDILGSIAHAKTLNRCGVLTDKELEALIDELSNILNLINSGKLEIDYTDEDIHSFIERLLTEKLGAVGKKIHTGRSRNDQVALDFRMYLSSEVDNIIAVLVKLEKTLIKLSKENLNTILPGFTHLQKAQPITFSHHMMAYFQMFRRDIERLLDTKGRIEVMPLGSGALAGTPYPLDRHSTAAELEMENITENSLDGVSDRDFAIELSSNLAIIMMHLSRFSEEIILWSSQQFGFIELSDEYSTGSSIMPQKKNPDVAELVRGKTGRVYGSLITLLTMMKGLPLAYNKDMQEDKEAIFDSIDTVLTCLDVFEGMLSTMKINRDIMYSSAEGGFVNATDLADYLVKKGIPFRDAHELVGNIVKFAINKNINLSQIDIEDYKKFSEKIDKDIYKEISLEQCVECRRLIGGPSTEAVLVSIQRGSTFLQNLKYLNS